MIMQDFVTSKDRLSFSRPKLTPHYDVEEICHACGEGIEEVYFTNEKGQIVHVSTSTNGHYYNDGRASCDGCHEGSR